MLPVHRTVILNAEMNACPNHMHINTYNECLSHGTSSSAPTAWAVGVGGGTQTLMLFNVP
jgi:hypothetical protein